MAKRELTAAGEALIKSPTSSKAHERELDRAISYMMSEIAARYANNVIGGLHKSTVAKFADDSIEKFVAVVLSKVDTRNQHELYKLIERRVGIPSTELIATEGLKSNINALRLETAQWVKKLRDDTLSEYTANTLREMAQGGSLEAVMKNFSGMAEKRRNHAKFTARNQISNFNAVTGKIRVQNLGITEAIWRTANDVRVRDSHDDRNDKVFDIAKGLYSSRDGKWLYPGIDFQCRCYAEYIIPED